MATNLAIAVLAAGLIWLVGFVTFLLVQLPIVLVAGAAGVWLFYVQHQFEETHWSKSPEWQFQHAALHGSSHYDLPAPLRWITGNIGIHHVHHLRAGCRTTGCRKSSRLPRAESRRPHHAPQSLRCVKLVLWDEAGRN